MFMYGEPEGFSVQDGGIEWGSAGSGFFDIDEREREPPAGAVKGAGRAAKWMCQPS
jgi:hypothetical protein